jgi:5-formyltetrahydrofolate cyclo-ligase
MFKADLRKIYLTKQKNLSPSERLQKSEQIGESFFYEFNLEKIKILHLFLSIEKNREIETRFIYEKVWRDFPAIKIVVPRVNQTTNEIESHEYNQTAKLALNHWQIPEPTEDNPIEADWIDVVLVPLLCCDKKGFRVGYGKGFYDKFLKNCRPDCLKIGLSYFPPIGEIADINEFDVTLDYCVTPEKVWKF